MIEATSPRAAAFLRTLRKLHAWVGLTGASFGLLMGFTGFLLTHRSTLKVEAGLSEESKVQIELTAPAPTPEALTQVLAQRLSLPVSRARTRVRPARPAAFAGAPVNAAALWIVDFRGNAHSARATYAAGDKTVTLERSDDSFVEALKNIHKAETGYVGWVLLADAFVGGICFMILSGVLMWSRLSGPRLLGVGLSATGLALIVFMASRTW